MPKLTIDFRPHLHQHHAIQSTRDNPVTWLCGGLGSGKSHLGVHYTYLMGAEYAPGIDGLVVMPDFASFEDIFMALWRQEIPGEGRLWHYKHTQSGGRHLVIDTPRGRSTVYIRSAMNIQNVQRIDGLTTIGWSLMDEPARMLCGEMAFEKVLGRTRSKRIEREHGYKHNPILIIGSPRGFNWLANAFGCTEDHPKHGYDRGYYPDTDGHPGYFIRACRTKDNAENLSDNYEENARIAYSQALYDQEFSASLISAQGMILPEWSKPIHVIPDKLADEMWQHRVIRPIGGMDWGFTAPAATAIMGWTGDHELIVIDEWYKRGRQVHEQGAWAYHANHRWGKRTAPGGRLTIPYFGDPADPGKIELLRKGFAWRGERMSLDIKAAKYHGGSASHTSAPTGWQARIDLLRSLLTPRSGVEHPASIHNDKLRGVGAPRFYVAARCKNLISEIPAYRQKEQQDGKPDREGAVGHDHLIDAVCGAAYTTDTTLEVRGFGGRR